MGDGIQLSEAITGDGAAIFRHACGLGLEGIVSKRIGSRYVSGRTRAWLKTKNPDFERRGASSETCGCKATTQPNVTKIPQSWL
jgi:ATP-dependent DNA ligase